MSAINASLNTRLLAAGLSRLQPDIDAATARISGGKRILSPADDPAGNAVASRLEGRNARLQAVETSVQNGASRIQATTDQLTGIGRLITRLSEIATLSNNPVQSAGDKAGYAAEFIQIQEQLRQTIGGTTAEIGGTSDITAPLGAFNGQALFGAGNGETIATGLEAADQLVLPGFNLRSGPLQSIIRQDASGAFTFTLDGANGVATLDGALDQVAGVLSTAGAVLSRLEFAGGVAVTARTNNEAALTVIQDTDVATETTTLTRLRMLSDSHTSMIAQARDGGAKLLSLLSRNS